MLTAHSARHGRFTALLTGSFILLAALALPGAAAPPAQPAAGGKRPPPSVG